MAEHDFSDLRHGLIRAGIAPKYVQRTLAELEDHFRDLVDSGLAEGLSDAEAEQKACSLLGTSEAIVAAMRMQPGLKSWAWRHPRLALLVYPLACLIALPAASVSAGLQHRHLLERWTACLLLSGLVTALMLLFLQLSITFA